MKRKEKSVATDNHTNNLSNNGRGNKDSIT